MRSRRTRRAWPLRLMALENRTVPAAVSWDGGAGTNNWHDALNWSSNALPTSADDVTISTATLVVFSNSVIGGATVNSLTSSNPFQITGSTLTINAGGATFTNTFTQTGGTLQGAGPISLSAASTISNGTWTGTGALTIEPAATLLIDTTANAASINTRTITNKGAVTWTGNNSIAQGLGSWTNVSGSSFQVQGNGTWLYSVGLNPMAITVDAGATLSRTTSAGTATINAPLNNSGTVTVATGTLSLTRGGTIAGAHSLTGNLVYGSQTFTTAVGASYSGTGTLQLGNATLAVASPVSIDVPFSQTAGTINGASTITFNNSVAMTNGSQEGTGGTTLAAGKTWAIDTTANAITLRSRTFINNGTASWVGNNVIAQGEGSWTNAPGSLFEIQGNGIWNYTFGATPTAITINPGSELRRSVSMGTATITAAVNNQGTLAVTSGALTLNSGGTQSGAFNLTGNLTLGSSTFTFNTGATVTGAGTLTLGNATLTTAAALSIDAPFLQTGGALAGTGTVTLNNAATSTGGTQLGGGTTILNAGKSWTIDTAGSAVSFNNRIVQSNGAVTWKGSQNIAHGEGTWTNKAGSSFDAQGNGTFLWAFGAAPMTFNIAVGATFQRTVGSATVTFSAPFNNDGVVTVGTGMLRLSRGGTQTGAFTVASELDFNAGTNSFESGSSIAGSGTLRATGGTVIWKSGSAPGGLNPLVIAAGTVDVITSYTQAGAFTMSSGTLQGTGTITFTGGGTLTGGNIQGTGKSILAAGLPWTINTGNAIVRHLQRTTENFTAVTWTSTGGSPSDIGTGEGAWVNKAGSSFDIQADRNWSFNTGSMPTPFTVDPGATVTRTVGTGIARFDAAFNNNGSVSVSTGTLRLTFGGSSSGAFNIAGSSTLSVNGGTVTFNGGTTVTGSGPLTLNNGTLTSPAALVFDAPFEQSFGTLSGTGTITLNKGATWTGGSQTGTGKTILAAGQAWLIDTSALAATFFSRTIESNGATTWKATGGTPQPIGTGDGAWVNKAGSSFDAQTNSNWTFQSGGKGSSFTVEPGATFNRTTSTNTLTFDGAFNNDGAVTVATGILRLNAGGSQTGSYALTGGLTFSGGTNNFNAGSAITGAGPIVSSGGTTNLKAGSSLSGLGSLTVSGGTFDVAINYTQAGVYNQSFGAFQGTGTVTFDGGGSFTGGNMQGLGTSIFAAGKSYSIDTSTLQVLFVQRTVVNHASFVWTATGVSSFGIGTGEGSWTNKAGSSFDIQTARNWLFNTGAFATPITNEPGSILSRSSTAGNSRIDGAVNNNGTIQVTAGTLQLSNGGTSSGAYSIATALNLSNGTTTFNTGTTVTGAGTLQVTGGTLTSPAAVTIDSQFLQSFGIVTGAGTLTLNNGATWTGGNMTGPGSTILPPGKLWTIDSSLAPPVIGGRVVDIFGTATWVTSGMTPSNFNTGDGSWTIRAGGVFDVQANSAWVFASGAVPTPVIVDPNGLLLRSAGTGTGNLATSVTNNGTIQVDAGTLDIAAGVSKLTNFSGGTLTGGTYVISSTFRFNGGSITTNAATITLNGPAATIKNSTTDADSLAGFGSNATGGRVNVVAGHNRILPGPLSNAGLITIDTVSQLAVSAALTLTGGDVQVAGALTANSLLTHSGGFASVTGVINAPAGYSITGGTLRGDGGSVVGNVTNSAGTVAPGASPGQLNIVGNYTQSGTGTLALELNGPTAITQYDRLNVTGTVALGGQIAATLGYPTVTGENFVVLTNDSSDMTTGTFNGVPENGKIALGGATFRVNYNAGDGNDVVLTRLATGIESIVIGDGSAQRSIIRSITVNFGGFVNFPMNKADAFQLTRVGPGAPMSDVSITVDTSPSTVNQTIAQLTFVGPLTQFNSLIDGNYTLSVFGNLLTDQGGALVDADNNNTPGGTNVTSLHRLYGDADGNKAVDSADFLAFRLAFLNPSNAFDLDGGGVDSADFLAFRLNFLKILP